MKGLILTALLGVLAAPASAANFSGKWALELLDRPGRTLEVTLILNQVGSDVTGSALSRTRASHGSPAGSEIHAGQAEGDSVFFYVWTGRDKPVKRVFKGTLDGDEIRFTVTGGPVRFDVRGQRLDPLDPQEVTAKRTK
jgi:hypothetical protein